MTSAPSKPVGPRTIVLASLAALLHFAVSLFIHHPLILPDEAGYLLNARRIATFGDPSQLAYFPGYSLLIAPIFAFTSDLAVVFRATQIVNALLSAATLALALHIVPRLFPNASSSDRIAAAAIVTLYPPYLFFSSLAVSENLFVPFTLLTLLLFFRFVERPTVSRAAVLGVASGGAVLIHQRAIALSIAAVVGLIVIGGVRRRATAVGVLFTLAGLVVGVALAMLILDPSTDSYQTGVSSRTTVTGLVTDNLGPRALFTLPFTILGQLFYLSVATLGLAPLAAVWLARELRQVRGSLWSLRSAGALWLSTVSVTTVIIAGLFMNQGTGDKAIYGRYLEAILAPLLIIGVIELLGERTEDARRFIVAAPAAAGVILVAVRGTDAFTGREQLLNVAAIEPIVRLAGIDIFWISLVGFVGAAALFQLVKWWHFKGLVVLALAYLVSSVFVYDRAIAALGNLDTDQELGGVLTDELLPLVASDQRCVSIDDFDIESASPWRQQNYRLEHFDIEFRRWDSSSNEAPCGAFVLTPRSDLETVLPGSLLVAVEPANNFVVWFVGDQSSVRGGPIEGSAAPTDFLEKITLLELSDAKVVSFDDDALSLEITLTNTTDEILVPSQALPSGFGGVAVGAEWKVPSDDERLHEPRRAPLPRIIFPGDQVVLEGELAYEIDDFVAGPGPWTVHFEVVQEGWRWSGPATGIDVEVILPESS